MPATPFRIAIVDAELADLRDRLRRTRWPDEVDGAGWDYGCDPRYLRDLIAYWRERFDWRAQEARLNALPQFRAEVNGIGIHFVQVRGRGPHATPLLLLHGWPSSFVQFEKIIPLLTDPAAHGAPGAPSFDVIAPSLPGYGFSDRPRARGFSVAKIAPLLHGLMTDVLGYSRYGMRSSDLGAGVATQIALKNPQAIIGSHTGGTNPYIGQVPTGLSPEEQEFVKNAQAWTQGEMAYAMLHSTKPQTLASALNDSPAGLASWLVEKFRRWGDTNGNVESRFSKDQLLTNITLYWVTQTIGSSMRLYYETARDPGQWGAVKVPVAMLMSPKDMFRTPRAWIERQGPIARWTEIDQGGHFLEWEVPDLVATDLRAFFAELS